MINCPKCGVQLEDGTRFCSQCGTQIDEAVDCQENEQSTSATDNNPEKGDEPVIVENEQPKIQPRTEFESQPVLQPQVEEKSKSLKSKTAIKSICIVLAVVIALLAVVNLFPSKKDDFNLFYIKDDELFYNPLSSKDPMQVTENLIGDLEDEYYGDDLSIELGYEMRYRTKMADDGKTVFFLDRYSEDGASLYYRNIKKPKEAAVKLDSSVRDFVISDDGKKVIYMKGEERNLYEHNLKEKSKIAEEVETYMVSDDFNKVVYQNEDGDLYYKQAKKDKVKLDSEISYLHFVDEDFKSVIYTKDDAVYRNTIDKDKEKLVSDVYNLLKTYESGQMYYIKADIKEVTLLDYIDDDMKAIDDALTEIEYPDYPYSWDYDSSEEYDAAWEAYEKAREKYEENRDALYEKKARDYVREALAEQKMEIDTYSLCYYNGKEETVISSNCSQYGYTVATDTPVIVFEEKASKEIKKVKISEIESIYDVRDMVEESLEGSSSYKVAVEKEISDIDYSNVGSVRMDKEGKTIYFIDYSSNESDHGDLYQISISNKKVKTAEVYDSDVYTGVVRLLSDGRVLYFKNVDDDSMEGELYIDKELVDYDVYVYSITHYEDSGIVSYFTDYNDEKLNGTLKMLEGKKPEKIADDVYSHVVTPDKEIFFISDFSTKNYKGTLSHYKNGKIKHIDDDVSYIVPVYMNSES